MNSGYKSYLHRYHKAINKDINEHNIYKFYFIVRYGYNVKTSYQINSNSVADKNYEYQDDFFDSITIINYGNLEVYYSHLTNIGFALIYNHFLPNEDLPNQYCLKSEIPIISHEFSHGFAEILIFLFFQDFTKGKTNRSYTSLGEGLLLGLQSVCLSIKTHYGNNDFTSYLLLGKCFFKWFKHECEIYERALHDFDMINSFEPISTMITRESNKIKESFMKLRNDFIILHKHKEIIDDFQNDIVVLADFTMYAPILQKYCPLQLFKNYILPEFKYSANLLLRKLPIENPASYHQSQGSGYISYYFIEIDKFGNLAYENTLHFLAKGLRIFCSKLKVSDQQEAKRILKLEIEKDIVLKITLKSYFSSIEEVFREVVD